MAFKRLNYLCGFNVQYISDSRFHMLFNKPFNLTFIIKSGIYKRSKTMLYLDKIIFHMLSPYTYPLLFVFTVAYISEPFRPFLCYDGRVAPVILFHRLQEDSRTNDDIFPNCSSQQQVLINFLKWLSAKSYRPTLNNKVFIFTNWNPA